MASSLRLLILLLSFLCHATTTSDSDRLVKDPSASTTDADLLQFALNLEHLKADFFFYGALGYGLDKVEPDLVGGGPLPIGAKAAVLDDTTRRIIEEFGYQEVGHLRSIKSTFGGFPRPQHDLSAKHLAKIIDNAFGYELKPSFDPYANSINYLLASYIIPYVGLVGYVGANPNLSGRTSKGVK